MTKPRRREDSPTDTNPLGEPIHRLCDAEGEIHIYAQDRLRLLTLGNQVEQTCIDLDHPARLVHAYTRAMVQMGRQASRRKRWPLAARGWSLAPI